MKRSFARSDSGQALVVMGLAMAVLMGAAVLTVDWGYGFATRRGAQNAADAGALAAGRLLASTYGGAGDPFATTPEEVWRQACLAARANDPSDAVSADRSLRVSFYNADGTTPTSDSIAQVTGTCSISPGTTGVDSETRFVEVSSRVTYQSLFGIVTRRQIVASGSARAQLAGAAAVGPLVPSIPSPPWPTPPLAGDGLSGFTATPNVALWPLAVHFDRQSTVPCGPLCDPNAPTAPRPQALWPNDPSSQTFTTLVSLAHASLRQTNAHQLLTQSDFTGSGNGRDLPWNYPPTLPLTNRSFPGPSELSCLPNWDTNGASSSSSLSQRDGVATACDLPNWMYYGYRGSLALGTDWWNDQWSTFRSYWNAPVNCSIDPIAGRCPSPLPGSRASCAATAYFTVRSCGSAGATTGDWVETVTNRLTPNMAARMREFIHLHGRATPYSAELTRPGGPAYGLAAVVNIFAWDCGEHFDSATSRWRLVDGNGNWSGSGATDCSTISSTNASSVDRVHLFTVVPYTFYEGLIDSTPGNVTVRAYPGGAVAAPGACAWDSTSAPCGLNPLINSAFLVPGE